MVGTVQNDSIILQWIDGRLIVKILLICAAVLLLFLGLASKAGAAPDGIISQLTAVTTSSEATPNAPAGVKTTSGLSMSDDPITYDDASCSICHSNNVQLEHQQSTGCALCHTDPDYTKDIPAVDISGSAGKESCGVNVAACHGPGGEQAWHGSGDKNDLAVQAMNDGHAVEEMDSSSLPISPMNPQTSCGGYNDANGPTCHSTNSGQSEFYFGSLDLAAAHADYSNAVNKRLNHDGTTPSSAITASASACGICHDKDSPRNNDKLKPAIGAKYDAAVESETPLTCLSCHDGTNGTYVTSADYYPTELQDLVGDTSLCYKVNASLLVAAMSAPVASAPSSLAPITDLPTSPETTASATAQMNTLLGQLSPDLRAQLSGVAGPQQQLSAGTLSSGGAGIPASALPVTTIARMMLFK